MWNKIISAYYLACNHVWNSLSRIISKLFQPLKLFQNYFRSLPQLTNVFRHVEYRWNNFISVSDVVTCEIKHWNNFKIFLLHMWPSFKHGFGFVRYSFVCIRLAFCNCYLDFQCCNLIAVWYCLNQVFASGLEGRLQNDL